MKLSPVAQAVRAHAKAHNVKGSYWARVVKFGDARLATIVGNRNDVTNALKAVRAYMRQLEAV